MLQQLTRIKSRATPRIGRSEMQQTNATIQTNVTPFIILCDARTGSNLLQSSLDQHPDIRAYGEVFSLYRSHRDMVNLLRRARDNEDGAAFVRHIFDPTLGKKASVIGFKMMYSHVPNGPLSTAWTELSQMQDLVVIDLDRDNLLERLVSTRIAEYTWSWLSSKRARREAPRQIYLSPGDCAAYFEERIFARKTALARFRKQEIIHVTYDALRTDLRGNIARICEALGVVPFEPQEHVRKQEKLTMRERIENFNELKYYFRNMPHAQYFQ